MATFTIIAQKHKMLSNGDIPLMIRIIISRKIMYSSLEIRVKLEQWDNKSKIIKKHPNATLLNNKINKRLSEIQSIYLELERNNDFVSIEILKKAINGNTLIKNSFIDYFRNYIEVLKEKEKHGTRDKFEAVYRKLIHYNKNRDLTFDEINVDFLKNYESYLRNKLGNSNNTIHGNFRIIRKLLNDAIREDLVPVNKNPFIKYKLTLDKVEKIYLTETEVGQLYNIELPTEHLICIGRDMFVFACYAGGLRISDLLKLKYKHYDGERITIMMHKTKQVVQVKLSSIAKEILHKYFNIEHGIEDYIFPVLVREKDDINSLTLFRAISSNTAYINRLLKIATNKTGINKNISFHTSRHTFATLALRKGIRLEYVSKLMGHSSVKQTSSYAKIVNEELDKAMELFKESELNYHKINYRNPEVYTIEYSNIVLIINYL